MHRLSTTPFIVILRPQAENLVRIAFLFVWQTLFVQLMRKEDEDLRAVRFELDRLVFSFDESAIESCTKEIGVVREEMLLDDKLLLVGADDDGREGLIRATGFVSFYM